MDESVKFYRDIVGLPEGRRFKAAQGTEICFMGKGETKVELVCGPKYEPPCGVGVSLGFVVKSVEDMIDFVKERELEVVGPYEPAPHIKFFFVKDPDGYSVQFVENK